MKVLKFITIALLSINFNTIAQNVIDVEGEANLYNTIVKKFHSSIVEDDFYIYISIPDEYDNSSESYPVLYLLEGDVAFGMGAGIARYLQIGNDIPKLIIVGIGYGELKASDGNMRRRDYTISSVPYSSNTGAAPKFRTFLKEELIPYIDGNFRTEINNRTLYGYSLSGLFAVYSLFTEPDLFNRYIIGSPHLSWDSYRIFDVQAGAFEKFTDINARIFISVGSKEDEDKYFTPIDELVTLLEEKAFDNLVMETKVFDGGTHLLCPPEVLSYGLVSVYSTE